MEELVGLFRQMLLKLNEISDKLDTAPKQRNIDEISRQLGDFSYKFDVAFGSWGLHDLGSKIDESSQDITSKIDEAVSNIVGETRYNLTDIHEDLVSIDSTITLKD